MMRIPSADNEEFLIVARQVALRYSRNNENGGLVTTMSACFRRSMHSADRKSPSPFNGLYADFLEVWNAVSVLVTIVLELDGLLGVVLAEEVRVPGSGSRWR